MFNGGSKRRLHKPHSMKNNKPFYIQRVAAIFKLTTPNCNPFAKPTPTNLCPKCIAYAHVGLRSILDTLFFNTLKIHSLFLQIPKITFQKNQKSPFNFQQNPITI